MAETTKKKLRGGWYDWFESEEGKRCGNASTLLSIGNLKEANDYLENRLWLAFISGAKYERDKAEETSNG